MGKELLSKLGSVWGDSSMGAGVGGGAALSGDVDLLSWLKSLFFSEKIFNSYTSEYSMFFQTHLT